MVSARRPLPKSLIPAREPGLSRPGLARPDTDHVRTCLLAPLHPERALSLALVQHLSDELPDVDFTLVECAEVDILWVCGYERGHAEMIRALRLRHPSANLLVTAKAPQELWSDEVLGAGADDVLSWPADLESLARALRRRPLLRRA